MSADPGRQFDQKLAELAETFSAAPREIQAVMYDLVAELANASAGALLVSKPSDPIAHLSVALRDFTARKQETNTYPIGKQKR